MCVSESKTGDGDGEDGLSEGCFLCLLLLNSRLFCILLIGSVFSCWHGTEKEAFGGDLYKVYLRKGA